MTESGKMEKYLYIFLIFIFFCNYSFASPRLVKIKRKTPWVEVEVVSSKKARAQGLMGPRTLPILSGMLFVFPKSGIYSFWMKDTFINLDIIFFDQQKKMLGCLINMRAGSLQAKTIKGPAVWALEVNAGFCHRYKLRKNDELLFR